jgi:hypothetical protein
MRSQYARRVSVGRHPMTVYLSKAEINRIKQQAREMGVTLTQLIQRTFVKEA